MNRNRKGSETREVRTKASGRAFCSIANLGAGFDVFGLAVNRYSDKVTARLTRSRKIAIFNHGLDTSHLPTDPSRNSAGPPAIALLKRAGSRQGVELTITKSVPQGLGLGSSGATAAACTKTLDHLLDLKLSDDELVRTASLGEKAVAGAAHADNVAASLLGGFVIVYDNPVKTIVEKPPPNLRLVVATPQLTIQAGKTRKARKLVPRKIDTRNAVLNVGRGSAIAIGFARGDIRLIGTGMNDAIAEPYRRRVIPGFDDVKRLAIDAGAAGVSISGAGPSLVAIVDAKKHDPREVGQKMTQGFAQNKVHSKWFVARSAPGATIVKAR